jgi:hypothetical protein
MTKAATLGYLGARDTTYVRPAITASKAIMARKPRKSSPRLLGAVGGSGGMDAIHRRNATMPMPTIPQPSSVSTNSGASTKRIRANKIAITINIVTPLGFPDLGFTVSISRMDAAAIGARPSVSGGGDFQFLSFSVRSFALFVTSGLTIFGRTRLARHGIH